MSVNNYITQLAQKAIINNVDREAIKKSISTLNMRLRKFFPETCNHTLLFGSYTRDTILPRYMDRQSDIDYMVIFTDENLKPQSYLDRLRRFVEYYYPRSEVEQSNPTIVLSLNHIRIELVPAIAGETKFKIPAKASDLNSWIYTDPTDFNSKLEIANERYCKMIKPLVRLMKYWNATNGYPFESYDLERKVAGRGYTHSSLWSMVQLNEYFLQISMDLTFDISIREPQWKSDALNRLKQCASEVKLMMPRNEINALKAIKKVLPPINI